MRMPIWACVLVGMAALSLGVVSVGCGSVKYEEAEAHLVANQETLVRDSQALIEKWQDRVIRGMVETPELPTSLRVPHLRFAQLGEGHVNLVIYASPDVISGFRVWVTEVADDYQDEPTSIPFVYRFHYNDDFPVSESNRP